MEYVIGLSILGLLVALAVLLFRNRMQIWGAVITLLVVMVLLNWFWSSNEIGDSGDGGDTAPTAAAISGR